MTVAPPEPDLPTDRRWASLRADQVARAVAEDPVVILPLGSVEQHGPHLPLSTDLDVVVGLLDRALAGLDPDVPVWTLPPLAVGASLEHAGIPGTVSLEGARLEDLLVDVGRSLARAGVRRLVLHTGHGGNRPAMDAAALRLRAGAGMLVVKVHYPRLGRPPGVDLPEAEWRHGLHAGAVETALMLHLRPGAVRLEGAPDDAPLGEVMEGEAELLGPQGAASFGWLAGDLHPSGAAGRPRRATEAMGRAMADFWGEAVARVIRETAAFPLERLG